MEDVDRSDIIDTEDDLILNVNLLSFLVVREVRSLQVVQGSPALEVQKSRNQSDTLLKTFVSLPGPELTL